MSWQRFAQILSAVFWFSGAGVSFAADAGALFDAANKAYEQRRFAEAAQLYEQVLASGARTAKVYFNLGTAHYQAGELGRAIAAYRMAEQLDPRDSDLRANLEFVRRKAANDEKPPDAIWQRAARYLTINEWASLAAILFASFFVVLAVGEWRGAHRRDVLWSVAVSVVVAASGLVAAAYDALVLRGGVVIAKQAPARFGPLIDSQVAFQLADGAEVTIMDVKNEWVQVRDPGGRLGWIKENEIVSLAPAAESRPPS